VDLGPDAVSTDDFSSHVEPSNLTLPVYAEQYGLARAAVYCVERFEAISDSKKQDTFPEQTSLGQGLDNMRHLRQERS